MLNDEQLAVVKAAAQPILVLAGAGSGKTRTLVHRVAHLIETGLEPKSILLLTFTNRAARHMLERVADLCGPSAREVRGGTFHHIALQLLREHAHCLGYQNNFMIMGRDDAKELMNTVTHPHLPKADVLLDMVSYTINTLRPLHDVIYQKFSRFYPIVDDIAAVGQAFMEKKLAMNMMDFDDMLMNWKVLLSEYEVGKRIRSDVKAILVDEYQDTNRLQGDIVDLMASQHKHLMVVGDDAQSIYGFRGADVNNMLEFEQRYGDAQRFYLNTNYRSTQHIVRVANTSLSKNLISMRHEGERVAVFECPCVNTQAQLVVQRIFERVHEGASLSDIAVLYRAHHHAMEVQMELLRQQIPFQLRSGLRFFEQAHMKDVTAYLRLIVNPDDEISFKRVAMLQTGVGKAKAERAWQARQYPSSLRRNPTGDVKTHIQNFLDSFYEAYLFQHYANAEQRRDDIKQLMDYARHNVSLETFLNELVLMQDLGQKSDEEQGVTLSSIHQAKGLEWPHVFVIGLNEGQFPSEMSMREKDGIEEERRLFYVAATRAQDTLALCHHAPLRRSRFIEELSDLEYVHVV